MVKDENMVISKGRCELNRGDGEKGREKARHIGKEQKLPMMFPGHPETTLAKGTLITRFGTMKTSPP